MEPFCKESTTYTKSDYGFDFDDLGYPNERHWVYTGGHRNRTDIVRAAVNFLGELKKAAPNNEKIKAIHRALDCVLARMEEEFPTDSVSRADLAEMFDIPTEKAEQIPADVMESLASCVNQSVRDDTSAAIRYAVEDPENGFLELLGLATEEDEENEDEEGGEE